MKSNKSVINPKLNPGAKQIPEIKKPEKKNKKSLKGFILTVLVLFLFSAIITGLGYLYIYDLLGEINHIELSVSDSDLGIKNMGFIFDESMIDFDGIIPEEYKDRSTDLPFYHENAKGITNIAIFGIDSKNSENGRSDAIMILTIDNINRKIKISSIIRDSYVYIEGRGMDKINHAYYFGGPKLAVKTLNQNFNLDIRHFVTVNFSSMPKVIDKIGGIYLEITESEAAVIPGIEGGGNHHVNGAQALAFSRIRKIDSDFERSRRQRDVMESIITKLRNKSPLSYPELAGDIFPVLHTNVDKNKIITTGANLIFRNITEIESRRFPEAEYAKGQTINRIYYYVFDRQSAVNEIGKFIYLDE